MEEVFKYIIGLGAAVMMPIIFTILGVCIGIKLPKALKSGLLVGCLLYTSPSPRDAHESRMPSSA